jgi:hypothetical protein
MRVCGLRAGTQLAPPQRRQKPYQFRHMLKHENMKPPSIMPAKMVAKPLPDNQNQAPIIPPIAMLASNQKTHVAKFFTGGAL